MARTAAIRGKARLLRQLLPDRLARELITHAAFVGDDPADVLADALELHLDALEGPIETGPAEPEARHVAP